MAKYEDTKITVLSAQWIVSDYTKKEWVLVNDTMHVRLDHAKYLVVGQDCNGQVSEDAWGYTYFYPNREEENV